MQRISTQVKCEVRKSIRTIAPKQSTINLIKQFARIYSYNETLRPGLRSLIPN